MTTTLALLEGRLEPSKILPYNAIGEEETEAAMRVMRSRNLSGFVGRAGEAFYGGPEVRRLESAFSTRFGCMHAVSFNSASTALQAAIAALGIGPGDEVITTPYTMSATATAVLLNNAIPVFADIDPETFCIDPSSVQKRLSPRTKAILAVNLFGGSADYDALWQIANSNDVFIIEDNAQAPGATYNGRLTGTIGDIGVFSLNVHKVIQCGEGGVLITPNPQFSTRAHLVRNHGEVVVDDNQWTEDVAGNNFRLSEIHAAIASEQLKKLDELNAKRIMLANALTDGLSRFSWIVPCKVPVEVKHVYYLYPFRFLSERIGFSRSVFARALRAEGFPVAEGYVKPIYLMPMYQRRRMFPRSQFPFVSTEYPTNVCYEKGICPVAERMYESELLTTSIIHPPNSLETVMAFIEALHRIECHADALKALS